MLITRGMLIIADTSAADRKIQKQDPTEKRRRWSLSGKRKKGETMTSNYLCDFSRRPSVNTTKWNANVPGGGNASRAEITT